MWQELAGVGTMTVSRVINGSVPVSEETRARVLAAIASLDYRPNEVARSLREARTRSIGVIVPNFYDSFFAWCAHCRQPGRPAAGLFGRGDNLFRGRSGRVSRG